jgi:hypothetical protein
MNPRTTPRTNGGTDKQNGTFELKISRTYSNICVPFGLLYITNNNVQTVPTIRRVVTVQQNKVPRDVLKLSLHFIVWPFLPRRR